MDFQLKYLIPSIPLFESLDMGDTDTLVNYLFSKDLSMGDRVCKEGSHADFVCFVASGKLQVTKNIDGKDVVISSIEEGGTFGEMALIDGLPRSATVKAKIASVILVLRRDDFNKLVDKHPKVGVKILKGIARSMSLNLRKASAQLTAFMTVSQ